MADAYELVFAFRDQSPSFVHGFNCGKLWEHMHIAPGPIRQVIQAELAEDVIAMATHCGWDEKFTKLDEHWITVDLTRDGGNPRQPDGMTGEQVVELREATYDYAHLIQVENYDRNDIAVHRAYARLRNALGRPIGLPSRNTD